MLRGRKLILNYTDGSPCTGGSNNRRSAKLADDYHESSTHNDTKSKGKHDDEEDEDEDGEGKEKDDNKDKDRDDDDEDDNRSPRKGSRSRRKSTVISFLCDRDPLKADAAVAFVAASPDQCTYFFEVRSPAACGGSESSKSGLGPGGVFGIM